MAAAAAMVMLENHQPLAVMLHSPKLEDAAPPASGGDRQWLVVGDVSTPGADDSLLMYPKYLDSCFLNCFSLYDMIIS